MPCANSNNRQDTSRNETDESNNDRDNENSEIESNNNDDIDEEEESSLTLLPLPPVWAFILRRMNNNRPTANMSPEEQMQHSRWAVDEAIAIIQGVAGDTRTNTQRSHHRCNFPPRQ